MALRLVHVDSRILSVAIMTALFSTSVLPAQSRTSTEFEIVSIKPNTSGPGSGGGMRTLPDGTLMMMNQPLGVLVLSASPVRSREVVGLPDWMKTDRYDVTAKPQAGLTREQLRNAWPAMWQAVFAERMHLIAHVEQRERDVYALVVARSDGRLGPNLKVSTLDCTPRPVVAGGPAPSAVESRNRCGMSMGPGTMVSGGITMDQFVPPLGGLAGGDVENHTGLDGRYALELTFSRQRQLSNPAEPTNDDAPDFFTAIQEQLGLKLVRGKKLMPVFVIDHIERPSEN